MKKEEEISYQKFFDIAQLIAKEMAEKLDEEERAALEKWRDASSANRCLYRKIIDHENCRRKQQEFHSYPLGIGWEEFRAKKRRRHQQRALRLLGQYAAILILAFSAGYYLWPANPPAFVPIAQTSILPGSNRAQLLLANGEYIDLSFHQGEIAPGTYETKICNQNNLLTYEDPDVHFRQAPETEILYNEICVPRCGEYRLKLSDGTVVHLNSMSSLRYPVCFAGTRREVILKGEAYFKVAPDNKHPFIVKTTGHDITVLGTEFNVSAFEDEESVRTTLVKGRVKIDGPIFAEPVILYPNQQFLYDKTEQQGVVRPIDVSYDTAWKDGRFRFRDIRLEEIMRTIERWYDVEVVYADPETKDYTFGLNFSRNETIDPLLRIFQENGKIKIKADNNRLIITKGR